jgi:hypothetical protein
MERKVWSAVPQIISPGKKGGEDINQTSENVKAGFNVMVIDSILTFYRQRVHNIKMC